jgi:hypothetical protein
MSLYASFLRVLESGIYDNHDHNNFRSEFKQEKSIQFLLQQQSSVMVVLRYCSPIEIQRALQKPQNTTIDILAVVAIIDATDHTPYYPIEIRELTLMDDMYVSKLVFDGHDFANFQYQYFGTLCSDLGFLRILMPDPQISESILISCGIENKFVLVQNVMVDQVSREYYIIYVQDIFVA